MRTALLGRGSVDVRFHFKGAGNGSHVLGQIREQEKSDW